MIAVDHWAQPPIIPPRFFRWHSPIALVFGAANFRLWSAGNESVNVDAPICRTIDQRTLSVKLAFARFAAPRNSRKRPSGDTFAMKNQSLRILCATLVAISAVGCQSGPRWAHLPQQLAWWKKDTASTDNSLIARSADGVTPAEPAPPVLPSTVATPHSLTAAATPPSANSVAATTPAANAGMPTAAATVPAYAPPVASIPATSAGTIAAAPTATYPSTTYPSTMAAQPAPAAAPVATPAASPLAATSPMPAAPPAAAMPTAGAAQPGPYNPSAYQAQVAAAAPAASVAPADSLESDRYATAADAPSDDRYAMNAMNMNTSAAATDKSAPSYSPPGSDDRYGITPSGRPLRSLSLPPARPRPPLRVRRRLHLLRSRRWVHSRMRYPIAPQRWQPRRCELIHQRANIAPAARRRIPVLRRLRLKSRRGRRV